MKTSLILFWIASLLPPSLQFFNTGYSIQDLVAETEAEFETDAALWLITPSSSSTTGSITYPTDINTCYSESYLVLGGPQILSSASAETINFQRTYKNLSTHVFVTFSIDFYYFGSKTTIPNSGSILNLLFDGTTIAGPRLGTSDVCSDSTSPTLLLTTFEGTFSHSSSSLNLVIQTQYAFQQIQVGFRQITLLFYTTSRTNSEAPVCQAIVERDSFVYDECKCSVGQGTISPASTNCHDCTSSCTTCFLLGTSCFTCEDGYFWSGDQCRDDEPPCCESYDDGYCSECSEGCFYYGDGVCQAACDSDVGYYSIEVLDITYCFPECSDSSQYRYLNGSCLDSCPSPLTNSTSSGNNYCYNPCSSSQYLYPDGTCNSACAAPLKKITIGDISYCQSPCSDSSQFYVNAISSCVISCLSPLTTNNIRGVLYCANPCQSSQYLYTNGSCLSTCPEPLASSSESIATYCLNPCTEDDYLYWDGSCLNTCSSPLLSQEESDIKYCSLPCQTSEYLYDNGTCSDRCESPFGVTTDQGVNCCSLLCDGGYLLSDGTCISECNSPFTKRTAYCDSPCSDPASYYYPSDGSCQDQCEYPNQITDSNDGLLKICILMVTEAEAEQAKTMAKTTDTANSISSGVVVLSSFLASSDASAATLGSLTKMLSYIKFMNIDFPPKLQLLFDSQNTNSSLLSSLQESLRNAIGNSPPPSNFEEYNVSPSFMINFLQSLIILGAILIVILISLIFLIFFKRAGVFQKILSALKWNAFLTLFCSYSGDVILFSALEFQTAQSNNLWSAISLSLCIGINIILAFVLYKTLEVNLSVRKIQKNTQEIEKTFGDFKTLFECYKQDSYSQQIYLFIFMVRVGLFNGVIGYLYPYPLAQAILIILINIGILLYLLIKRPMKKLINLVQQVLLESIIFVFNIGVFLLAIFDAQDQDNSDTREKIGDVLIMINVIVPILSMILIAIKILLILWEFYQNYKMSKTPTNNNRINIQQARTLSYSSQNTSPEIQSTKATSKPKNQTDQTNNNLLPLNCNNNNSLFSLENIDSSFHLHHGNSPQRRFDTSSTSQNSTLGNGQFELNTLNISSVEETHQVFSRNRNDGKRIQRRNPVNPVIQRRRTTKSSRPRQFMNDLITFDPQIDN